MKAVKDNEVNETVAEEKVEQIPLGDVYKIIAEDYAEYSKIEWYGYEIAVRTNISYEEMDSFVDAVVDACFNQETGEYEPQHRDFMFRYGKIAFYTNFELPQDTEEAYRVVYALCADRFIDGVADACQLEAIQDAITEKIDYRLEQNVDMIKAELNKMKDMFAKLGETMSSIDPEEVKKTLASISEHGKLDEAAIVKALFNKDGESAGGES